MVLKKREFTPESGSVNTYGITHVETHLTIRVSRRDRRHQGARCVVVLDRDANVLRRELGCL